MNKTLLLPTEADARKAYKEADDKGKKLLINLWGSEVFNPKPLIERLDTFEDVCEEAGVNAADYVVLPYLKPKDKADMFMARLMLFEKVLNGDNPINRADINRKRYYPWHKTIPDADSSGGFRLSFNVCAYGFADAYLGARPEFNDPAHATFVGTRHIAEYEGWAQNFQLSKTNP